MESRDEYTDLSQNGEVRGGASWAHGRMGEEVSQNQCLRFDGWTLTSCLSVFEYDG